MSLSLLPTQDSIIVRLKQLPQTIYENGVPNDVQLKYSNGVMLPYITPFFGGFHRAIDGRGITSVRQDLGESYVTIECVGPTERSARQVADLVLDKLTGFQPTDGGPMTPSGASSTLVADYSSQPPKYISQISFRFVVNINVVS